MILRKFGELVGEGNVVRKKWREEWRERGREERREGGRCLLCVVQQEGPPSILICTLKGWMIYLC